MARYIDAEKFAKRIKASPAFENMAFEGELLRRVVLDILGNQPTADVVEVVRCKDCKHSREQDRVFGISDYKCSKHNISCLSPYDFCSYGERSDT